MISNVVESNDSGSEEVIDLTSPPSTPLRSNISSPEDGGDHLLPPPVAAALAAAAAAAAPAGTAVAEPLVAPVEPLWYASRTVARGGLDFATDIEMHIYKSNRREKRKAPDSSSEEEDGNKAKYSKSLEHQPGVVLCPLSKSLMVDPVIAEDGITYEHDMIKEWVRDGSTTSPIDRNVVISVIYRNIAVRKATEELVLAGMIPEDETREYLAAKGEWYFDRGDHEAAARMGMQEAQLVMSCNREKAQDHESAVKWAKEALANPYDNKVRALSLFQMGRLIFAYGPSAMTTCRKVLQGCLDLFPADSPQRLASTAMLSCCVYMKGDYRLAFKLAIESKSRLALLTLGALHFHGLGGLPEDHEAAFNCFKLLSEESDEKERKVAPEIYFAAQAKYGWMLTSGRGCSVNVRMGMGLLQDCCEKRGEEGGDMFVESFNGV